MPMRWMPVIFTDGIKKKRSVNGSFWLIGWQMLSWGGQKKTMTKARAQMKIIVSMDLNYGI